MAAEALLEAFDVAAIPTYSGIPFGRRTPKGRLRWYLVEVPQGREQSFCDRVRRIVPTEVLANAFVPVKERWVKRSGAWSLQEEPMYKGFFFALSADAAALDAALSALTFPVRIVGSQGRNWTPLSDDAMGWLESVMDADHVIRNSTAVILDGNLHVQKGPLVGQEMRVTRIDRHRRIGTVRIACAGGELVERLPLEVPSKS